MAGQEPQQALLYTSVSHFFFALPCIVDICELRRWEHPSANLFQAPSSRYSARPHLCLCLQLHLHATVAHLLSLIRETKLHYFCTSAIKLQSSQGRRERKNVVCTITVVYISQKAKQVRQRERQREIQSRIEVPQGCRARREGVNKNIVITTDKRLIAATSFIVSSFNPSGPHSALSLVTPLFFLHPLPAHLLKRMKLG